jgi:ABC-2 type transport system ATP-binding protein
MDEAERCDDLLLLRDGRLLFSGAVNEIRVRTGTSDLDDAFLRLVEEESA